MAQTLKLKRGNNSNFSSLILETGEPAFVLDTGKLYIGNGTDKVLINPDQLSAAESAAKLTNARTIAISGGVTGTATSFDGSANITIPVTALDATKLTGTASINTTGNAATATTASACSGNAATASSVAWSGISGKPTTLSGYGITDALSSTSVVDGGTF